MSNVFELRPGTVPAALNIGNTSVGVPILVSAEYPQGAVQMNIDPTTAARGRLAVDISGEPKHKPEIIEVRRQDDPAAADPLPVDLQIEVWVHETGPQPIRTPALDVPVPLLIFSRSEEGIWVADTGEAEVVYPPGFNQFAKLVFTNASIKLRQQRLEQARRRYTPAV